MFCVMQRSENEGGSRELVANEERVDVVGFGIVERRMRGLHCELRVAVHEALLGGISASVVVKGRESVDGRCRVRSGSCKRLADD